MVTPVYLPECVRRVPSNWRFWRCFRWLYSWKRDWRIRGWNLAAFGRSPSPPYPGEAGRNACKSPYLVFSGARGCTSCVVQIHSRSCGRRSVRTAFRGGNSFYVRWTGHMVLSSGNGCRRAGTSRGTSTWFALFGRWIGTSGKEDIRRNVLASPWSNSGTCDLGSIELRRVPNKRESWKQGREWLDLHQESLCKLGN